MPSGHEGSRRQSKVKKKSTYFLKLNQDVNSELIFSDCIDTLLYIGQRSKCTSSYFCPGFSMLEWRDIATATYQLRISDFWVDCSINYSSLTRKVVWPPPEKWIYKEEEWCRNTEEEERERENCECGMAVNHAKAIHSLNLSIHLPPSPASSLSMSVSLLLSISLLPAHLSFSPTSLSFSHPLSISHL